MADLIDRAAAIDRIDKCVALSGIGCEPVMAILDIKALISVLPAVDAVPVVHGRWAPIGDFNGYVCCSACHGVYIDPDWIVDGKWSYCPNCGAKMDGERRDEE